MEDVITQESCCVLAILCDFTRTKHNVTEPRDISILLCSKIILLKIELRMKYTKNEMYTTFFLIQKSSIRQSIFGILSSLPYFCD